ncbi:hypothetical protein NLI96_g69 [Meripilus lineatus]|uniref:Uncharacterized protein n=1 Tax=Meripilus lineatus TaxID=2056292 RepID=A0AAD5YMF8_9APHY|nr:hypothetical protein NLI96_g69 [Physisporinus lineatus]
MHSTWAVQSGDIAALDFDEPVLVTTTIFTVPSPKPPSSSVNAPTAITTSKSASHKTSIIVGGVVGLVTLVIILTATWLLHARRSSRRSGDADSGTYQSHPFPPSKDRQCAAPVAALEKKPPFVPKDIPRFSILSEVNSTSAVVGTPSNTPAITSTIAHCLAASDNTRKRIEITPVPVTLRGDANVEPTTTDVQENRQHQVELQSAQADVLSSGTDLVPQTIVRRHEDSGARFESTVRILDIPPEYSSL